ncbi:SRPBCC family protein [Eilatimonas milleporae]|uniref:Uncharacterized protein YndB with AHSA1/START domain n=1 Tax=Eilatimonas milleporae TaxID=911205 RepID=A0A3M0CRW3_9PROT|nr:SRPBCC domain-containing protein [Eilatimonas milleporae]RMB12324.1 uncharacterized protein YndB with AHSA1/START domain [Eilatimonas milleporae]
MADNLCDPIPDIVKSIDIAAPPARVWAWLSEPEKLAKWLMPFHGSLKQGETVRFYMDPVPDGDWDGEIRCHITALEEDRRLAFTWTDNQFGYEDTYVEFILEDRGGTTRLTLSHKGWDALTTERGRALRKDHDPGWDEHITVLGALAEGRSDQGWLECRAAGLAASC